MATMLARRSLARSLLPRMVPAMSGGMQQGGELDLQNSQGRYKSSHAENTNKFIVEVRGDGPVASNRFCCAPSARTRAVPWEAHGSV